MKSVLSATFGAASGVSRSGLPSNSQGLRERVGALFRSIRQTREHNGYVIRAPDYVIRPIRAVGAERDLHCTTRDEGRHAPRKGWARTRRTPT